MTVKISTIARFINGHCVKGEYFWACGLVKETLPLWKDTEHQRLLRPEARMMVEHYLEANN